MNDIERAIDVLSEKKTLLKCQYCIYEEDVFSLCRHNGKCKKGPYMHSGLFEKEQARYTEEVAALETVITASKKQLAVSPEVTPENEHICPICQCSNGSGFNFCWGCGQNISRKEEAI